MNPCQQSIDRELQGMLVCVFALGTAVCAMFFFAVGIFSLEWDTTLEPMVEAFHFERTKTGCTALDPSRRMHGLYLLHSSNVAMPHACAVRIVSA